MRLAMPRTLETPVRVVPHGPAPLRGAIEPWEVVVLVVLALALIVVAQGGIDLSRIPFTGWIHP